MAHRERTVKKLADLGSVWRLAHDDDSEMEEGIHSVSARLVIRRE